VTIQSSRRFVLWERDVQQWITRVF